MSTWLDILMNDNAIRHDKDSLINQANMHVTNGNTLIKFSLLYMVMAWKTST